MIYFVTPADQEFGMRDYLAVWGRELAERIRIIRYDSLPRQTRFNRGVYILSALDQLSPAMGRLVQQLHRQLVEVDGLRMLNHPVLTLRRFELLTELRRLKHNDFRAVRATDNLTALRYPVFVRPERLHSGAISPLLQSVSEVEALIGRALLQGHRLQDLLVVEFCDTADGNGFYRKYAAFVVGKQIIARSLAYGRHWMLKHEGIEFSRPMVLEERDYVLRNPHESELAEIFEVARVEYGRIDYAVKDGQVQTWEINLNPTIGRGVRPSTSRVPVDLEPIRQETKEHFYRCFRAALEAVDLTPDGQPAVSVALDSRTIRAAQYDEGRGGQWLGSLRKALQPVRPALEPLAVRALAMLGRLARWAGSRRRANDE